MTPVQKQVSRSNTMWITFDTIYLCGVKSKRLQMLLSMEPLKEHREKMIVDHQHFQIPQIGM